MADQIKKQGEPFESDAHKLASKHLSDPNHVITEEELKSVRIGMTPSPDEPTQEAIAEVHEKVADRKGIDEDAAAPGSQKASSWDVLE